VTTLVRGYHTRPAQAGRFFAKRIRERREEALMGLVRPTMVLHPGRERPLLRRHPWVFSGAVNRIDGDPGPGDTIDVISADGGWLARAAYSPHSQIRARVWTWKQERIDEAFFRRRLEAAIGVRARLAADGSTNAYRLVHAESDGLPGLIVDRYADWLVVQHLTAGSEAWRTTIHGILVELTRNRVYERSDSDVRQLEGLGSRSGLVAGGQEPGRVRVQEHGLSFWVDISGGQKTGFYLDQRENRHRARELAAGGDALDAFCYSGGFTVSLLAGGANSVLALDSSADALSMVQENVLLNGMDRQALEIVQGDVFQELRRFRDSRRAFDLIVLDPPKFAPTRAQAETAARGYKDINLLAFKCLRPGGILMTFSCSSGVGPELFQKIVAGAALDAGIDADVLEWLGQPADHPVDLAFPEARYLKGLVCLRRGGG
jgi:23S rRNA (cytosine1962-C5)-methyltransferase